MTSGGAAFLADRAAVLLLGVAVGSAIGWSFGGGGGQRAAFVPARTTATAASADMTPEVLLARQCPVVWTNIRQAVAQHRPVRIAVFGDSYGDGVWAGLNQQLRTKDGFDVVKYSQQATGFTRYKSINLEERAAEQLGHDPVEVAVVSFGANDAQGIILPTGKYAPLMSAPWQREIGARVDRFVDVLRAHHAIVFWVGLPVMREAKFDADVHAINDFYAQRMAALGVPFMDSRPIAADPSGQFAPYLPDPKTGKTILMRASDGIHMSMTGYVWITREVVRRIRAYVSAVKAAPAAMIKA